MALPHLSAEKRDEVAYNMVAEFVHGMKSDARIGEKWAGLSNEEQMRAAESMFKRLRPLMDDMEADALKVLSSSWD